MTDYETLYRDLVAGVTALADAKGRRCNVCTGRSPAWDGHDKNPPCEQAAWADLRALFASSPAEGEGEAPAHFPRCNERCDGDLHWLAVGGFYWSTTKVTCTCPDDFETEVDCAIHTQPHAWQEPDWGVEPNEAADAQFRADNAAIRAAQVAVDPSAPVSSGEAGHDTNTHVCSCGTIDHYHAGDCNIWLNDRPAPVVTPNTEGSEQA